MSLKSLLGLDIFDVLIQGGITGILISVALATNSPRDGMLIASFTGAASLAILGIRRRLALGKSSPAGLPTGEIAAQRIAELEQRLAELEAVHDQVADLAERLDFAERLLAQPSPPLRIGTPEGGSR